MKYSLAETKAAMGEVQKMFNWQLRVAKAAPAGGPVDPSLLIRCQSAGLPSPQVNHIPIRLGGHEFNNAGKVVKRGNIPLTLIEGTDARVVSYFNRLLSKYWTGDGSDTQGNQAPTVDLKGDYILELMDGQNKVNQTYKLIGVMFTPQSSGQLGQEAQEMSVQVMADYDDFHLITDSLSW